MMTAAGGCVLFSFLGTQKSTFMEFRETFIL